MENKFLQNKVVYLKPVVRKKGIVDDPKHIAYFKMEGSYDSYTLKYDSKTGKPINPFKSDEEMQFFSNAIGEDLNPYKPNNEFWSKYSIKIIKTPELMNIGKRFDLSDVYDALSYRVLLTWTSEIAPTWEDRLKNISIRYAFVEDGYEETKSSEEMEEIFKIGTYYGELKVSDKTMKDYLDVYYMNSPKKIHIPEDFTTAQLVNELNKIIKNDKAGFIKVYEDPDFKTKLFICRAVDKGVINKVGVGTYIINGVSMEYTEASLIAQLKDWAETKSDPIYSRILAEMKAKK